MKISITNSRDFMALLVRRKWWVIGPFLALTGVLCLLVTLLPEVYVSETLILVRPRDVPEGFVIELLTGSSEQRLKAIEQTVLSRSNLLQILNEFGAQMPEYARLNLDERVVKLRSQIRIIFESQRQPNGQLSLTYFRISYQDRQQEVAQKIAQKLTALFVDQDNKEREKRVFGTTEFLTTELEKVATLLGESEEQLRKVKTRDQYQLPSLIDANLRAMERIAADRRANSISRDRLLTMKMNAEQAISDIPDLIPKPIPQVRIIPAPAPIQQVKPSQQPAVKPPSESEVMAKALADVQLKSRVEEYLKAKAEYEEASINHTASHPDVMRALTRLNNARKQVPDEILNPPKVAEAATSPDPVATAQEQSSTPSPDAVAGVIETPVEMMPNPAYRTLTMQLQGIKTELDIVEKEKAAIDRDMATYSQRIDRTPGTERELSTMLRENGDLKKQFDDLSGKLAQAKLAESLESRQKGAQFVIVDPANYPLSPQKPEKKMVALGAGALSLLFAIGLAVGIDVARQRVWAASEVEALWGVPVLVDIPEILLDTDVKVTRRKWQLQLTSAMAAAAVYGVCLYGIYLKHGFILRQLDPLLQKIVYR